MNVHALRSFAASAGKCLPNDTTLLTRGLESYESSFVPRRKYFAIITKTYRLILFKEEIRIYSERYMKLLNKFCRKNAHFLSIKTCALCSNQFALEGHKTLAERETLLCTFK